MMISLRNKLHIMVLCVLPLVCLSTRWAAGAPAPCLYVPVVEDTIVVDGVLDEPAWQSAPQRSLVRFGGLTPLFPVTVRVLCGVDALYIGFDAVDWDVRAELSEPDARLWEHDDVFEVFVHVPDALFHIVELQINPRGTLLDILHHAAASGIPPDFAWNGVGIDAAASVDGSLNDDRPDKQWQSEFRIPFAVLTEMGAPAPRDREWRLSFACMNRLRLDERRVSREISYWPPPSVSSGAPVDDYAPVLLVDPVPDGAAVEGFSAIVEGHSRYGDALSPDYRGMSPGWEYDTERPDAVLQWKTAALAGPLPEQVSFVFVGQSFQAGGPDNPERAEFELRLDGRPVLRFEPYSPVSRTWNQGAFSLTFRHYRSSWHPSGSYLLTVPRDALEAGRSALLEVHALANVPATRFLLKAYTDAALVEGARVPKQGVTP